jgi:hypothetical protein
MKFDAKTLSCVLSNLGDYYPLIDGVDLGALEEQLVGLEAVWCRIASPIASNLRFSLELISCENGSGIATKTLNFLPSLMETLQDFMPFALECRLVQLDEGGYLSFSDCASRQPGTIKLVAPLTRCDAGQFTYLYDDERIYLDKGRLYFLNSNKKHAVLSFGPNSLFLELYLKLNLDSAQLIYSRTFSY